MRRVALLSALMLAVLMAGAAPAVARAQRHGLGWGGG
jgi:hypothetical protein